MKVALDRTVFLHLMSNTDEGQRLEKEYGVKGHPSFVLTNASGDVLDRWVGYRSPPTFIAQLSAGLADPTTESEKRARFERSPAARDAATLARVHAARGERAEAVTYYRRAIQLDPTAPHEQSLLDNLAALHGQEGSKVTAKEVVEAADAANASPHATAETRLQTAFRVLDVAKREKDASMATPFIDAALAATDEILRSRQRLQIEQALHVDGDRERALKLKRESMPAGWMEDSAQLNEMAWWSFENRVGLADAEALARKAAELSQPGPDRAQVLDTQAELAFLRGAREEAIALMRRAMEDDPSEEHYRKQLARFEGGAETGG